MTEQELIDLLFYEIDNLRDLGHKIQEPTQKQLTNILRDIEQDPIIDNIVELKVYIDDIIFELLGE